MGVTVLAEYVETAAQRETLAKLGCYHYQGYLYSPPVPLEKLLRQRAVSAAPAQMHAQPEPARPDAETMPAGDPAARRVRTPLMSLVGLSDIALQKYGDPELRSYFEQVREYAQSLLGGLADGAEPLSPVPDREN